MKGTGPRLLFSPAELVSQFAHSASQAFGKWVPEVLRKPFGY
jgi:hypothetical protein